MAIISSSCHCGLNRFKLPFSIPTTTNDLCHCNSCRHSTGQLFVWDIPFKGPPLSPLTNEPADLSTLREYSATGTSSRYFCPNCSAHLLWRRHTPELWCAAAGTLETTEGIAQPGYHIWIGDTVDGGIADNIKVVNAVELPRYKTTIDDVTLPLGWRDEEKLTAAVSRDRLKAFCRCGAVSLEITRPSSVSALPSSPYADALFPYATTPSSKIQNPDDEKWWLRPVGGEKPTKYLAAHCSCKTCRLTSGFDIQSWAFIPRANIFDISSGSPLELNLRDPNFRPKGIKQYKSSPGRSREFCGTCGATVFWWGEERPNVIDVSVGLIDQEQEGARAEGWLDWQRDRVSFDEDALNKSLVQGLIHGLRA